MGERIFGKEGIGHGNNTFNKLPGTPLPQPKVGGGWIGRSKFFLASEQQIKKSCLLKFLQEILYNGYTNICSEIVGKRGPD